ncbi:MAG: 2-phospho-L-lactate guanylyltransferase [Chloroflexi bacterium]|nr:2-phospho-L-lactate guanylyltransferase [Chloroflexota bacterium]
MTGRADAAGSKAANFVVITAVQDANRAKSRLGPHLDPGTRRTLVMAMLDDLLTAVREVWSGNIVVVSPDSVYDAIAQDHRARVIRDAGTGYNDAIRLALAETQSASAALILPGDLPHANPSEIAALLEALLETGVTVVPAEDGGTLALGLHPPDVIEPRFGPQSASAHGEAARATGVRLTYTTPGDLRHDIDTLDDLARVWDRVGEATTALLEHLAIPTIAGRDD